MKQKLVNFQQCNHEANSLISKIMKHNLTLTQVYQFEQGSKL